MLPCVPFYSATNNVLGENRTSQIRMSQMSNSTELLNNGNIKIRPVRMSSIKLEQGKKLLKISAMDTITYNCFTVGQST